MSSGIIDFPRFDPYVRQTAPIGRLHQEGGQAVSLRHIAPTLGLIACAAGTAQTEEIGDLTLNGYVDAI